MYWKVGEYLSINLTDYRIGSYGQAFADELAKLYGFSYEGMATNRSEAEKLGKSI